MKTLHECFFIITKMHRNTTHVDMACCYRPSSVVCLSVGLSVCHNSEPCKNGWTGQDDVSVEDSGGSNKPCIRWGSRSPLEGKTL